MKIDKSNIYQFIRGNNLNCVGMGVTSLVDIPDYITIIDCSGNLLTSLPKLPSGLEVLFCFGNYLTSYPYFNDKQWFINHNKLLNRTNIINKINETR